MNAIAAGPGFPRAPPSEKINKCSGMLYPPQTDVFTLLSYGMPTFPEFSKFRGKTIFVFCQAFFDLFPGSGAILVFHADYTMNYLVNLCFVLLCHGDAGFSKGF